MGQTIQIGCADGSFSGYLATPAAGRGPGIVLCQEIFGVNANMRKVADYYAEEGYTVLVPDLFWRLSPGIELEDHGEDFQRALGLCQQFDEAKGVQDVGAALTTLRQRPECVGHTGVLGFCLGGKLAYLAACRLEGVACAVGYYGVGIEHALSEAANLKGRLVLHIAQNDGFCPPDAQAAIVESLGGKENVELHVYQGVDHAFARADGAHFDKSAALIAHQRSIAALRGEMGPHYDLSALWDKHCEHEFFTRDVDATMATMVSEPYVNHIPTMTGGVGYRQLKRFYQHHFVHGNPPDISMIPISRTIGASQVVDESLLCFTHTTEIDWMLPGVKPTGRRVEIPLVGIIKFRGDKLYHEHIYWDQASVLVQIGLLDPEGLPVAGVETGRKLLDESLPSNTLMARWKESEGK
ncbi:MULTISPECIES: dienelactone hydrolase family protein [Burkholderia]|uniref:dienelactone hydrolase family protein n=1 Tax=Burkholderia TaxID=32008 RepID=UPI0007552EE1|nr:MULTISPECIES: dienelactone hydrolase family protein [Burkholderia]KVF56482.1 carboxymethylenebutenolidase [Burkholderia cepacia]MBR8394823.1 dienelactone hydrolase family protein [Burkholderia cenocepacia]MBR8473638.1 dienelactone hydrolase family protein [Burkholderia cenocepacia]MBR8493620.1 dienelactone hydrolase family protein [Burkholderia cenocepacia]MBY4799027.1 dienelactone hydrolase family protein [Burkholderia cepacia]